MAGGVVVVIRAALALLLVLGAGQAAAQVTSDSVLSKYMLGPVERAGGGWTMGGGTQPANMRVWSTLGTGSGAKLIAQDAIALAARGGPMTVQAIQSVGVGAAARGIAAGLGGPAMAVGSAAYLLYDLYRVREASSYPGTQCGSTLGALCFDPGVSETTETVACLKADQIVNWSEQPCSTTIGGAAGAYAAWLGPASSSQYGSGCGTTKTVVYVVATLPAAVGGYGSMNYSVSHAGCPQFNSTSTAAYRVFQSGTTTTTFCPASLDPSNPAYSVPAGSPKGPDGKCPTSRYNHAPVTVDQAAAKVEAHPPASPVVLVDPLKDALAQGKTVPSQLETQGPATQTGTPTTTTETTSSGTTTKTTVPTYAYNYAGDTITYNTTTTTYTCAGAGSCSSSNADTTTTTTTSPPEQQDPEDPCTANPDRAGCRKLGTVADDVPIKAEFKTLSITPVSGFGPSSAACPSPRTASVAGVTISMPFTLLCQFADGIRPVVVGLAWVSAVFGFIGIGRRD